MFGVKSSAALIVFSILYGFFSGACELNYSGYLMSDPLTYSRNLDISLIMPLVAGLAKDMSEIG